MSNLITFSYTFQGSIKEGCCYILYIYTYIYIYFHLGNVLSKLVYSVAIHKSVTLLNSKVV